MVTGMVADIRNQDCKVLPPRSPMSACPSTGRLHPNASGASAAVIGEALALRQMEQEKEQLEGVKRRLSHELELQALLQEQEHLELCLLEMELLELEEKQIIDTMDTVREEPVKEPSNPVPPPSHPEPMSENKVVAKEPSESLSSSIASSESGLGSSDGKSVASSAKSHGEKRALESKEEIAPLSPAAQKRYRTYWARFVATPQNQQPGVPEKKDVKAPPPVPCVCN